MRLKNPFSDSIRHLSVLSLAFVLGSCNLYEDKSKSPGATGSGANPGISLFMGKAPNLESTSWQYESGVDKSALGTLNPVFFDPQNTPLRTPGSRIWLNLFDSTGFTAVVDKARIVQGQDYSCRGHIEGIDASSFIVTTSGNALSAIVRLGAAGTYRVTLGSNGQYRVIKQNDFTPGELDPPTPVIISPIAPPPVVLQKSASTQATHTVHILVVYTADALAGAGGTPAMNALIDGAIEEANEAYDNSGIDLQLNLVHTEQITYTETDSIALDLNRLTTPSDGYMDGVQALRDTYKADVVTLVTETTGGTYAGLGWVMNPVSPSFQDHAFNVVMRLYMTGYDVLPHEVGHNMGCMHDAQHATSKGAFPYSYGWRFTGNDGVVYRTVMAYQPGTGIPYFSNPNILYQGKPVGTVSKAYNALTINNSVSTMAAFRGSNSAPTISVSVPGDGKTFGGPTNLVLAANVTDDIGVDSVVFMAGATKLATDRTVPYKIAWTGVQPGSYNLTAIAYDHGGLTTTSSVDAITVGTSGLSSPWNDAFLGLTGMPGKVSLSSGTYTLQGGGTDFAGTGDGGQFAYTSFSTGSQMIARIASVPNVNANAKAGMMIRDTLATGGKMAFVGLSPDGTVKVITRAARNANAVVKYSGTLAVPYYLMWISKASTVAAYASSDGATWNLLTSFTMSFPTNASIGLAATSADTAASISATFDHVTLVWGAVNFPSQITAFKGPLPGQTFNAGTNIPLAATITDLDGLSDIFSVRFYNGSTLLNTDHTSPYSYVWPATSGSATLTAQVMDMEGNTRNSDPIPVTINPAGTLTVNPSKDAYVNDGGGAAKNFGTATTLMVQSSATSGKNCQSFLVFPISSMSSLSAATLRFYGALSSSGSVTVAAYSVADTTWIESGATGIKWNTKPAAGGLLGSTAVTASTYGWNTIDVGPYVAARKTAGASYVSFVLAGTGNTIMNANLVSRNAAAGTGQPELVLSP